MPILCRFATILLGVMVLPWLSAQVPVRNAAELQKQLDRLQVVGSVLYIAAHPDDENTAVLTTLSKGRNLRTAYLSMTRGGGGQNLIGPELGDGLAAIRTQELLAARRLDCAEQFFTSAVDFGYSKTAEESLRIWNHDTVLGDVVRTIRTNALGMATTLPRRCWPSRPSRPPPIPPGSPSRSRLASIPGRPFGCCG